MESLAAGLRNLKKPWLTGRVESAKSPVGTFSLDHLPAALKEGVITRGTARARAASQGMSDSDSDESLEVRWGGCVRASSIACRAWQSIAAPRPVCQLPTTTTLGHRRASLKRDDDADRPCL